MTYLEDSKPAAWIFRCGGLLPNNHERVFFIYQLQVFHEMWQTPSNPSHQMDFTRHDFTIRSSPIWGCLKNHGQGWTTGSARITFDCSAPWLPWKRHVTLHYSYSTLQTKDLKSSQLQMDTFALLQTHCTTPSLAIKHGWKIEIPHLMRRFSHKHLQYL